MGISSKFAFFNFIGFVIISIICSLILDLIPLQIDEYYLMFCVDIISILELGSFIYVNSRLSGTVMNYCSIFFVLLFIFHFGQVTVFVLGMEDVSKVYGHSYLRYFTPQENYYAFTWINYAFVAMYIGALIVQLKNRPYQCLAISENWQDLSYIRKKAVFLLAFTFPVQFIYDICRLYLDFTIGHVKAVLFLQSMIPSLITGYGRISIVGMGVLLVSLKHEPKKQRKAFYLMISYFIIMMLGGSRGMPTSCIFVLTFLYLKTSSLKWNVSSLLKKMSLIYLFLTLVHAVVRIRERSRSFEEILDLYVTIFTSENVLIKCLHGFGLTGYTAECVLLYWLDNYPPSYGISYYLGVLYAISLNIGDVFSDYNSMIVYGLAMQENHMLHTAYLNIGGSVVGEAFFNFGTIGGVFFSLLIGWFIGFGSKKIDLYLIGQINAKIGYYIIFILQMTFLIRAYFPLTIRSIVYSAIAWWLVLHLNLHMKLLPKSRAKLPR